MGALSQDADRGAGTVWFRRPAFVDGAVVVLGALLALAVAFAALTAGDANAGAVAALATAVAALSIYAWRHPVAIEGVESMAAALAVAVDLRGRLDKAIRPPRDELRSALSRIPPVFTRRRVRRPKTAPAGRALAWGSWLGRTWPARAVFGAVWALTWPIRFVEAVALSLSGPRLRLEEVTLERRDAGQGVLRGAWAYEWALVLPNGTKVERGRFALKVRWREQLDGWAAEAQGELHVRSALYLRLLELVPLPAGTFLMGSPKDDEMAYDDERPQHAQTVAAFSCGRTVVTEAQWAMVMGGGAHRPHWPKVDVSYDDAVGYCKRLSVLAGFESPHTFDGQWRAGDALRLPTEIEWEYAARAGTTTRYSFGDDPKGLGDHAWFNGNSGGALHPVAEKAPNPWGLYDMHGLILEWCWSRFELYPLRGDPSAERRPSGEWRVVRGGAFNNTALWLRSALRNDRYPGDRDQDQGFRCVGPSSLELDPLID